MSFNPTRKVVFSTPNTYTWICPPSVEYIDLTMIGAGGGGGGGGGGGYGGVNTSGTTGNGGGGGGSGGAGASGAFNSFKNLKVIPGTTYTVVVGAGGTNGAAGSGVSGTNGIAGGNGGNSTFTFPTGIILISAGGVGGVSGTVGGEGNTSGNGSGGGIEGIHAPGNDGVQTGLAGGTNAAILESSSPLDITNSYSYLYQIYTDVQFPNIAAGQFNNFPPLGGSELSSGGQGLGNSAFDTFPFPTSAVSQSGSNGSSQGGGAGGVLFLNRPIPLYWIGVDFSLYSSTIQLPAIFSNSFTGLGNGQIGNSSGGLGGTPSSANFNFWADNTATKIGFGAGGLGGPGGGGGAGRNGNLNYGGNGYHGDIGLGGLVIISW